MVSQGIWIGITVGVFFAGLGIGYAVLQSTTVSPMMMTPQQMQQMIQDPEFREQMMNQMMQNPEMMQAMMQNQQMMEGTMSSGMMMGSNPIEQHEKMLELMGVMMNNKDMMNHMFAHMIENEQIVHQMFTLMDMSPALKEHMAAHVSGDLSEYEHLDEMHDEEEHGHEDEHQ